MIIFHESPRVSKWQHSIQFLRPKKSWHLVLLTSFFWWSIISTFELYPEFNHFSPCPPFAPGPRRHLCSSRLCNRLPANLTSGQSICHTKSTMIFLKCSFVPLTSLLKALQWFSIWLGMKLKLLTVSYKPLRDLLPAHGKLYVLVSYLYLPPHSS